MNPDRYRYNCNNCSLVTTQAAMKLVHSWDLCFNPGPQICVCCAYEYIVYKRWGVIEVEAVAEEGGQSGGAD